MRYQVCCRDLCLLSVILELLVTLLTEPLGIDGPVRVLAVRGKLRTPVLVVALTTHPSGVVAGVRVWTSENFRLWHRHFAVKVRKSHVLYGLLIAHKVENWLPIVNLIDYGPTVRVLRTRGAICSFVSQQLSGPWENRYSEEAVIRLNLFLKFLDLSI